MKYSKDSEFQDPVVRCDSCADLVQLTDLVKNGKCHCGNRKVRSLLTIKNWDELHQMRMWNVDKDFLAMFANFEDCQACQGTGGDEGSCLICEGHGTVPGVGANDC